MRGADRPSAVGAAAGMTNSDTIIPWFCTLYACSHIMLCPSMLSNIQYPISNIQYPISNPSNPSFIQNLNRDIR
ncbi:uncharacterized protein BO87DRAFT_4259 [Aspergillus neoniger CBS 115656]|uniref:Uncharacterized protein n=1 Tax=Aspergillus neoniger (strain CBS 115656) TaxID=1448310 RepID=A0A318Z7J1_ASPNB|nr:hypothetical protein BO87DRAFT_4259 [Aspergillus neoniger CBS 115656]PYH39640.1 hypothetical protein BO87DRAFT_4259 [Aspergillus neoniger CBS 115656]